MYYNENQVPSVGGDIVVVYIRRIGSDLSFRKSSNGHYRHVCVSLDYNSLPSCNKSEGVNNGT